jgi:pimeloyl-ACP methyl ester carboxylesterase
MNRRDILRRLASVVPLAILPTSLRGQGRVHYEVHGAGPTLLIGSPITLFSAEAIRTGYLDRLTDRYRVVLMHYPSGNEEAASFTPDRVSADMLAVADAAEAERFAWYGFSWGGVVGLQLAARTNRLTALICAGWPPLGGPYGPTLGVT